MTKFSLSFGKRLNQPNRQDRRVANDNLSREQELFEMCVQRELGGIISKDKKAE